LANFYTNVQSIGGNILYRGIKNGQRIKEKIEYSPSLYLPSKKITNITSLDGDYLDQKIFGTIQKARDFIKQFDGVSGASKIYGQTRFEYAYIADEHRGMVDYDYDKVSVAVIDIEVGSENGFPDPYQANEPITAICIRFTNSESYVFGCGEYEVKGKEIYFRCKDEYNLCKSFINFWKDHYPDIITGWNTKFFDIPYLVNRFRKILGEPETKKLSPWNYITERKAIINGREMTSYSLVGVESLDYIDLLRKSEKFKFKISIDKTPYSGYDSGAIVWAVKNHVADYYFFFHDSLEIKTNFFEDVKSKLNDSNVG
jgi:DNA polymerase elongation subunit (family B)